MTKSRITLDYLEFYCQANDLMVSCNGSGHDLLISPEGFTGTSYAKVDEILGQSSEFELTYAFDDEFEVGSVISREELEDRLRRLMN